MQPPFLLPKVEIDIMIACGKNMKIESNTPYKLVVVRTSILIFLTH
jgi:hypothetical protein